MKIALMMENSQAAKNKVVLNELTSVAQPLGHTVYNVGMCDENDHHLTYVHLGIMASVLLNSKAVDFIFAGCGTGQGAMMSLNAHPGVNCGYCLEPADAFLFNQINNGNALALAFAKGFGWGAELNLRYIFEKAFTGGHGEGYPKERKAPQVENAKLLNDVKASLYADNFLDSLAAMPVELVKGAVAGERFKDCLFENSADDSIVQYIKSLTA